MLGSDNLTDITKQQAETAPGMAFFAGTGPANMTCGHCKFKGYTHDHTRGGRSAGCYKAYEMMGKRAPTPVIEPGLKACKYFEKASWVR